MCGIGVDPAEFEQESNKDGELAVRYMRMCTKDQHLGPGAQGTVLTHWFEANAIELAVVLEDAGVSGGFRGARS
jgi:hypothetical protein